MENNFLIRLKKRISDFEEEKSIAMKKSDPEALKKIKEQIILKCEEKMKQRLEHLQDFDYFFFYLDDIEDYLKFEIASKELGFELFSGSIGTVDAYTVIIPEYYSESGKELTEAQKKLIGFKSDLSVAMNLARKNAQKACEKVADKIDSGDFWFEKNFDDNNEPFVKISVKEKHNLKTRFEKEIVSEYFREKGISFVDSNDKRWLFRMYY